MFQVKSIVSLWLDALNKRDFKQVCELYTQATPVENLQQLQQLILLSAQCSPVIYGVYQQVAVKLLELKPCPAEFIGLINTEVALNLFFPAIKEHLSFDYIDNEQRNCLHYLFCADQQCGRVNAGLQNYMPPFNFIRSLLLFESNEPLMNAICHKDTQGHSPFHYFFTSLAHVPRLNDVEFSSAFGLIEIANKQAGPDKLTELEQCGLVSSLKAYWTNNGIFSAQKDDPMLILVASYYHINTKTLLGANKHADI